MVYRESFKLESRHRAVSFHDITEKVKEIAAKCNIKDGIAVVTPESHRRTLSIRFPRCLPATAPTTMPNSSESSMEDTVSTIDHGIRLNITDQTDSL